MSVWQWKCDSIQNFPKTSRKVPSFDVKSSFKNCWFPSSSKMSRSLPEILSFQSVMRSLALSIDSKVELTFLMSLLWNTTHWNGDSGSEQVPGSRSVRSVENLSSNQGLDVGPQKSDCRRLLKGFNQIIALFSCRIVIGVRVVLFLFESVPQVIKPLKLRFKIKSFICFLAL